MNGIVKLRPYLVLIATIKPETVAWQFNLARQLVWVWTMTNCASSSPVLHCFTCTSVCRTKQSVFVLQSVSMYVQWKGHMFLSTSLVPMGGWSLVILLDDVGLPLRPVMKSEIDLHYGTLTCLECNSLSGYCQVCSKSPTMALIPCKVVWRYS